MSITNAYMVQVKNLGAMLIAIRRAQAPDKFTTRFLVELGFKSTNDRLFIGVLKGLGFLDESGAPKQRYFDYLDETQHRLVLGLGVQEAYADLFKVNNKANEMSQTEVKAKLKTLTQGTKSDGVLTKMAMTFAALCKEAEFNSIPQVKLPIVERPVDRLDQVRESESGSKEDRPMNLNYVINIELPPTRDQAIYDAIFRSLREHIL